MIAAISPADINYEETLSTLRYADRAKAIVCKAVINEDANARLIRDLKEEIMKLRELLKHEAGIDLSPDGAPIPLSSITNTAKHQRLKSSGSQSSEDTLERLKENQKLMDSLCMSYEEKLKKTEKIMAERYNNKNFILYIWHLNYIVFLVRPLFMNLVYIRKMMVML